MSSDQQLSFRLVNSRQNRTPALAFRTLKTLNPSEPGMKLKRNNKSDKREPNFEIIKIEPVDG